MSIKFLSVLLAVRNGHIIEGSTINTHLIMFYVGYTVIMKGAPKVHQWMAAGTGLNFISWCQPVAGSLPAAPILHFPLNDPAFTKRDAFNNSEPGWTPPTTATKDPRKLLAKPASQQADSVSFASLAVRWPYGLHNHPWDESAHFWSGAQKSHDTLISRRWYCPSQR